MRTSRYVIQYGAALLLATALLTPGTLAAAPAENFSEMTALEASASTTQQLQPAQQAEATNWQLLLVNPWHELPEDFTIQRATLKNGLQVDTRIYDALNEMLMDCREEGLEPIVCSAYRSEETQTRLYRNKVSRLRAAGYDQEAAEEEAARWVAPPGTSEHQTGLALDIVSADYQLLDEAQAQTPEQKWLMENSWKYGFILRYPEDKEAITGIGYEPWHYRYVGIEAAADMHETGQCLEEYLQANRSAAEKTDGQPLSVKHL